MRQPLQAGIDLLGQQNPRFNPPRHLGLNLAAAGPAWSLQRLEALLYQLKTQPTADTVLELRFGRHCLSRFWLEAPVDQLPSLWEGPIGDLSRSLAASLLPNQPLSNDEQRWRERLLNSLASPDRDPARLNSLLAVLPFLDPQGHLPVTAAELPSWLHNLQDRCQGGTGILRGLLNPAPELNGAAREQNEGYIAPLPRLIPTEPTTLLAQLNREEALQRGKGLLRLHRIEPDDAEILAELLALRQAFAQLLLDLDSSMLEAFYRSSLGDLYRNLVQAELPLRPIDDEQQAELMKLLLQEKTGRDDALLMATVLYLSPNRITLNWEEFNLPEWMTGVWRELSGDTLAR
jgi:hypothetical protein